MNSPAITPSKDKYKVRNWKEYNSSLCKRGSLTLWLEESILLEWDKLSRKKKEVGKHTYPESIIQCCLLMKINYRMKLRQSTGFLSSIFFLLGQSHFLVPDYTTLCRRQKSLSITIEERLKTGENLAIAIDSTGLKVYGEGEWKVRKHGYSKHRTWRKLHICIDLNTQEILTAALTGNNEDDASVGKKMLEGKTINVASFHGDGAYDDFSFREVLGTKIIQVIPPPKNAVIQKDKKNKPLPDYLIQRNQAVEHINKEDSKSWKEQQGYHRRSLNEVVMFRYKIIFGDELDARTIKNQETEAKLKCCILNKFTGIGMPDSYKAA
jgi:hypothetical protein